MSNSISTAISGTKFLTFENTDLNIIDLNGSVWLTAGDLARALGYKSIKSISTLYNRNKDEFREDETALIDLKPTEAHGVISLMTSGNLESKTRIYSTRGCMTVAFLARTDNARAFRTWVKDVLENLNKPTTTPDAPQQKTYLPNADHLSLRDTMMHPNAFEKILDIAECMTGSHDVSDWERAINKRAGRMAAERLEEVQMDAMMGVRMLTESDHIGGFKTTMLPNNARLLLDNEIADYIRSASGPRMRMLPDIIHACTERLNELYELPLHGLTDDEG